MRLSQSSRGPKAAREWATKNQPVAIRDALSKDLVALSQHHSDTASKIYTRIDKGIDDTALLLSVLACSAIALALAGIVIIARSVTRPISAIASVTEAVAAGVATIAIPSTTNGGRHLPSFTGSLARINARW